MDLNRLLSFAVGHGASDLHIHSGAAPMVRVEGQMRPLDLPAPTDEELFRVIGQIIPAHLNGQLANGLADGIDFSHHAEGIARFRCSAFQQMGRPGLVMRAIADGPLSLAALNLPEVLSDIALARRGLILVVGTTGSGKSTTMAALVDAINSTYRTKIVTIEDPVEYLHQNKKSLIAQFEVGQDTPSFVRGLRQSLRQDPDVILIGEMRDVETLRIALRAADTGHQVISTVHSADAPQTIQRIIAMFPPEEHKLLLSQLARSVEAIVGQRLVPMKDGGKRIPAVEILRGSPVTERLIMRNEIDQLSDYIATGEMDMQTFDQHLLELYNEKVISGTQALHHSSNTEAMSLAMRGIRRVGGGPKA